MKNFPLSCPVTFLVFLLVLFFVPSGFAEDGFYNAMSLQGFTGLLNVPNAEVTDEGKVVLLYSDQEENTRRRQLSREDSYIFSLGLLPYFELGGRLTDGPPIMRDLSANFKIKVPFIPQESFLPQLAFGMQDVGGGAKHLQTKYAVASREWWRLRFSLGYGSGPDRMDGVFGGLEVKACDWLYLLGENDTEETNVGIRIVTPEIKGWPVSLQATAKSSLDYRTKDLEFGIGLQFPLGGDRHNKQPLPEKSVAGQKSSPGDVLPASASGTKRLPESAAAPTLAERGRASLIALREKLAAAGFQNLRTGMDPAAAFAVIEFENSRYNHNELDGLGVVIGMAVETLSPDFLMLQIVLKAKGIRMLQLSAPLADFRAFMEDGEQEFKLDATLAITDDVAIDDSVRFIGGNYNSSLLKSELILYPALSTLVGSDYGNFDYFLSLKTDYYLNLWKGAVVNARADVPLDWSDVYDTGQPYGNRRRSSQFERLMLLQAFKITPDFMLNLGGGEILHDTYGALNEAMWSPGSGNHRFSLKQAYLHDTTDNAIAENKRVYLGSYRYYFRPLDLSLIGTAGKFLDQDRGFKLELKRFFGDTALTVFYKNSKTAKEEHVEMGGVQIAIPLTPRRDMKPYIAQVKGNNDWTYVQETKIVTPGDLNLLDTSIGVNPQLLYNLERVFYNRDRLTEDYIRKHLLRLRDAYLSYR